MAELATIERNGQTAKLTLRRADSRNALSIELLSALHARLDDLASDELPRVLVVTGEGKAFCAGMDLKQVTGGDELALELLTSLAKFTYRLRTLSSVVVAEVNGAAIGGGCGLVTVCDFAITHADAKLGFPEVDLGLCPAVVAPWVVRKVGAGRARSLLLRGGVHSGGAAHEMGLVSDVVATREDLAGAVHTLAERLSACGTDALRATKGLLNELDGSLDEDVLLKGAKLSASVLSTPEAQARLKERMAP